MSKSSSRKKIRVFIWFKFKKIDATWYLGYGNSFHLLEKENFLQMTIFEEMVEFDIFYRESKKFFDLLNFSLHNWRIVETIHDRCYRKDNLRQYVIESTKQKKMKVQEHHFFRLRRKNGVAHEEKNDNELEK